MPSAARDLRASRSQAPARLPAVSGLERRASAHGTEERRPSVAVVIPCHDEAGHVGAVVRGFQEALPDAAILVVDNASRDDTAALARQAGARVLFDSEPATIHSVPPRTIRLTAPVLPAVVHDVELIN